MLNEPTLLSPKETFVSTLRLLSTLSAPRLVHIQTFVYGQALFIHMVTNNTCTVVYPFSRQAQQLQFQMGLWYCLTPLTEKQQLYL